MACKGGYHITMNESAIRIAFKIQDDDVHDEIRYDKIISPWKNPESLKNETTIH